MKKLIYILLLAVLAPLAQSCNTDGNSANTTVLATVRSNISKFGFMLVLDNKQTVEVTDVKCIYKPIDGDRVLAYCDLENTVTPGSGYNYSAAIYQVVPIVTTDVKTLSDPADDNYGNDGIKVLNAWVSGGFLNLEFQVYLNNASSAKCDIQLVNNTIGGNKNDGSNNYYELELRNKSDLNLEEAHSLAYGIACFRLGELDPEREGLTGGIKLIHTEIGSKDGSKTSTFAKIENPEIDTDWF